MLSRVSCDQPRRLHRLTASKRRSAGTHSSMEESTTLLLPPSRRRRPRSDPPQRSQNRPRGSEGSQISPSQAASARPNHETPRDATAVHNNRLCAARACVGHADEHLHQIGGAELPPRGACDRDAVDADAAPRPPAKAVLNSLELPRDRRPGAPLRRSFVESRVKIYICNPGFLVRSGRNSRAFAFGRRKSSGALAAATACRRRGVLAPLASCGAAPKTHGAERNELYKRAARRWAHS